MVRPTFLNGRNMHLSYISVPRKFSLDFYVDPLLRIAAMGVRAILALFTLSIILGCGQSDTVSNDTAKTPDEQNTRSKQSPSPDIKTEQKPPSNSPFLCHFDHIAPVYLLGKPIRLTYVLETVDSVLLRTDDHGNIEATKVILTEPDGNAIEMKLLARIHSDSFQSWSHEVLRVTPGKQMRLLLDVTALYDIKTPGKYTISLKDHDGGLLASEYLNVSSFNETKNLTVTSVFDMWPPLRNKRPPPKCRVTIGSLKSPSKKTLAFLVVEPFSRPKYLTDIRETVICNVPVNSEILHAEMDIRNQVWIILKSGNRQALVVFFMETGQKLTLIPWTEDLLEMGATPAASGPGKMVIAGRAKSIQHSTFSIVNNLTHTLDDDEHEKEERNR
ncbi:MAG: hypothetical protein JXM70_08880 [Pirellulales bacterium]|nr:hypothetical protein [Pirellulales bacterium]